jgi:thiosulfate/3-mercaptopyruvate sulfurtransferase
MKRLVPFLLLFPLVACGKPAAPAPPLVSPQWLRDHRAEVVLVDVQTTPELYEKGHLKGAVHLDFEKLRVDKKRLAPTSELAARFGELGIDESTPVVLYDEKHGRNSGYVWYALTQLGHPSVSILDGHMDAFEGELETGPGPKVEPKTYHPRKQPEVVSTEWVKEHMGKVPMLDARPVEQYTGEKPKEGMKGGHIPGAASVPWDAFTGKDGRYLDEKDADEVLAKLLGKVPAKDEEIVLYCNTYHQAGHLNFVLARLGYTNLKAYEASMKEWEAKDEPLEKGGKP